MVRGAGTGRPPPPRGMNSQRTHAIAPMATTATTATIAVFAARFWLRPLASLLTFLLVSGASFIFVSPAVWLLSVKLQRVQPQHAPCKYRARRRCIHSVGL